MGQQMSSRKLGRPLKINKFDHPIWKYEVQYEARLRACTSNKHYVRRSHELFDFLSAYPEKHDPRDYYSVDVEDWYVHLQKKRGQSVANESRQTIRAFFNWMRDEKGVVIQNPANVPKRPRVRRQPPLLTLEQLHLLSTAAETMEQKRILSGLLGGLYGRPLQQLTKLSRDKVFRLWRLVCQTAGLTPLPPKQLVSAYRRLCLRLGEEAALQSLGLSSLGSLSSLSSTLLEVAGDQRPV